jgi:hypothetical protein
MVHVSRIQSGAFKWEHLNISVVYGYMKKFFGTKLHCAKGEYNDKNKFLLKVIFVSKFQGHRCFFN